MNLIIYLKLVRWKNLLLISYVFYLINFQLYPTFNIESSLTNIQFFILYLSAIAITAAGNIINDIFDVEIDEINKPKKQIVSKLISIEKAKNWYQFTNGFGVVLGIGLCLKIEKPTYSFIFITTALLLYYYSKTYKGKPLLGNLIVSFLVAFSILIIPLITLDFSNPTSSQLLVLNVVILLSAFAFAVNLIREVVKDIIDVNGDNIFKLKTLPILIGRGRSKVVAFYFCIIPIVLLLFLIFNFSDIYKITILYLLIFSLLPLVYVLIKLRTIKSKKEFQKISNILKLIMFFGVNSILIFSLNN